jgi:hypothetical protein
MLLRLISAFCVLQLSVCLAQTPVTGLQYKDEKGKFVRAKKEKRVALLIGNANYKWWGRLETPLNDIKLMSSKLQEFGFETEVVSDLNREQFAKALEKFETKIHLYQGAGHQTVAMLYYAGHGIESAGINYLVPVSDTSNCRTNLRWTGVKLSDVQEAMASATMRILCVDACRDQGLPFTCAEERGGGAAQRKGFNNQTATGVFLSFSTEPGSAALDRSPLNPQYSPYALALAKSLEDGKEIKSVFTAVRRIVSQHGQVPIHYAGYDGAFYFSTPETELTKPVVKPIVKPVTPTPDEHLDKKFLGLAHHQWYGYGAGLTLGLTTLGSLVCTQTRSDWNKRYLEEPRDKDGFAAYRQKYNQNQYLAVGSSIATVGLTTMAIRAWRQYRRNATFKTSSVQPNVSPMGVGLAFKF